LGVSLEVPDVGTTELSGAAYGWGLRRPEMGSGFAFMVTAGKRFG
jgi:hypothetical protein